MSVLLDTNILLRSVELKHPMHGPAQAAVDVLLGNNENLVLVAQNLYDFWVASTRPVAQNGLGLEPSQTASELAKFKNQFALHDDTPAIRPAWEQLVMKYQVIGKNAHDARLVAAMITHSIKQILTFNTADFQRYNEIEAIAPEQVIAGASKGS
jgi:predicted nucleic acid-binding protein